MPKYVGIMVRHLQEGIRQADSFLLRECGAIRLPESDVRSVEGRTFVAGWQLAIETPKALRRLNVFVDGQFPFSLPHFVLVDRRPFLTWPHIEEDGLLCLPSRRIAKFREPGAVIGQILHEDVLPLIRNCETGANQEDFRTEFYSYWNRALSTEDEIIRSLLMPTGPSRIVQIWRGKTRPVIGEDEVYVLSWLRNLYGNKPQFDSTEKACLLWIDNPLLPSEYPRTAADVYRIAASIQGGSALLEQLGASGASPYYFILGSDSENGPCLAAVRTQRPTHVDIRGRQRNLLNKGFRPGKVPVELQTQRLFSSNAVGSRMQVERVDGGWIHGRGRDPRYMELSTKTVIVIGCGSLGAPVAHQVLMAGVGHTILVDPDKLAWSNVGRHPLGADHVGEPKAIALANVLRKSYPHSHVEGFEVTSRRFLDDHADVVMRADLIICATADWKSEIDLNFRQLATKVVAPIVYVWTEPNACAGHAVLIPHNATACLQCGFSSSGDSKLVVTEWPAERKEYTEPACGAVFQPYGPVELLGTILASAGLALDSLLAKTTAPTHRVWAGSESQLSEAGGVWSKAWTDRVTSRIRGSRQEEYDWECDPLCEACGASAGINQSPLASDNLTNVS
jgi:sulfur-carrier protein adenylyltransferase/sulfurtransferase